MSCLRVKAYGTVSSGMMGKVCGIISRGVKNSEIDENGHLIFTLTDNSTADLGKVVGDQGEPGAPGANGEDGYSPAVTVTEITGGHRVTITDKTHQSGQSFDVMDGEDGASSADQVSYDNSDSGLIADNVQSAIDELSERSGSPSWEQLSGKPFNALGETLTVDADGVLNIVIPPEYGRVSYDGVTLSIS